MTVQIVRKGAASYEWNPMTTYVASMYNISITRSRKTAIFNSASGAVVIIDGESIDNSIEPYQNQKLVENGILVPSGINEYQNYLLKIKISDRKKPSFFTIIPTTCCNARCFYCYEEEYAKRTINKQTISKAIDYIAQHIDSETDCVLDWYGGEPLLSRNVIDQIIKELKSRKKLCSRWSSSITTNGILFSDEMVYHATNEWNLRSAFITIDGTEKEHNKRKNVYLDGESAFKKTISGVSSLLKAGIYVNLRIHLDNDNKTIVPSILEEISFLFEFDNLHLFPTYLFPPEHAMPEGYIRENEKEQFFYDVFKAVLMSGYKATIDQLFPLPRVNGCFATKENTIVISPDGDLHSCVQGFSISPKRPEVIFGEFKKALTECRDCRYFPICIGGCLYNRTLENSVRTPCVRNRYIVKPLLELLLEERKEKK